MGTKFCWSSHDPFPVHMVECNPSTRPEVCNETILRDHFVSPKFRIQKIQVDGATIHVRAGGKGTAVVMLHGFGDTGDMWGPVAAVLIHNHTVVVPDLRGMGLSSHPKGGHDKKTQARDIAQLMDKLNIDKADFVTHDIGNMVGYAFAAQFPTRVTRWVVIDAPLPGIGPWDDILRSPALWHFNFRGPDAERLVKGRER